MTISLIRTDKPIREIKITKRKVVAVAITVGVIGVAVACVPVIETCGPFAKVVPAFVAY